MLKKESIHRLLAPLALLALCLMFSTPTLAAVIDSHWAGGSGNWNSASNWNPNIVPNNGGGDVFHVTVDDGFAGNVINVDMNPTVQSLIVSGSSFLRVNDSRAINVRVGPIVNQSVIRLNGTSWGAGLHVGTIVGDDVVQLTGGGVLVMSPHSSNRIIGVDDTNRLVNVDNLIRGSGRLGDNQMRFTNQATVRADDLVAELVINPRIGMNGVINTGVLEAVNEAVLRLQNGTFNNSGGTIRSAPNSVVRLHNATILGGLFEADESATIEVAAGSGLSQIDGMTLHINEGAVLRINDNSQLQFGPDGTYDNEGLVHINGWSWGTQMLIAGPQVTISGGGAIRLANQVTNRIRGASETAMLVNMDNVIHGGGLLGDNFMRLTNHGVVRADDVVRELVVNPRVGLDGVINTGIFEAVDEAILRLQNGTFNNADGVVRAKENSRVRLENVMIAGGHLEAQPASRIETWVGNTLSVLDDMTLHIHPGGEVVVNNSTELRMGQGTWLNEGTLQLNSTGSVTTLRLDAPTVTLTGGGMLRMSSHINNIVRATIDSHMLVNADNLIHGGGQIGQNFMRFTNHGIVRADDLTTELIINPRLGSDGVFNTGLFEAVDEAFLRLEHGTFNNHEGTIRATAGSRVRVGNATVLGGNLIAEADGRIETVVNNSVSLLDDLMLHVEPDARLQVNNRTELRLGGNGTYLIEGLFHIDGGGNLTTLRLAGEEVTLAGGGELSLTNTVNSVIRGGVNTDRLINQDLLIRGGGRIGLNEIGITNHGTIDADQVGEMTIDPSVVLGFENTGTLRASGLGGMNILSGPFTTSGQVVVELASKITRTGTYEQTAGSTHLYGDLQVNSGTFHQVGGETHVFSNLQINNGTVQLDGGLFTGDGTVIGSVTNNAATVQPGSVEEGDLFIQGAYTQVANGTMQVNATVEAGLAHLSVTGNAVIAGTLHVVREPGFTAPAGVPFSILSAASVSGEFDDVIPGNVEVTYTATDVLIAFTDCAPADLNCDGSVGVADLLILLANWGPCADPDDCPADLNGDGTVGVADLLILLANWG